MTKYNYSLFLVCRSRPHITTIVIDFPASNEEEIQIIDYYYTFECLARLPLSGRFFLGFARLEFDDAWSRMAQVWPLLASIEGMCQPASNRRRPRDVVHKSLQPAQA
jgi:hypothetical protein